MTLLFHLEEKDAPLKLFSLQYKKNGGVFSDIRDLSEFSSVTGERGRSCCSLGVIMITIFSRNHWFCFLEAEILR